jgi:galactonate dehydratase
VTSQETPWGLSRLNQAVFSGIEMACWDIVGKHHGIPVHEALGGKLRDDLRVYANGWYDSLHSPAEFAEGATDVVDRGYDAMKFDPFETAIRDISNDALKLAIDRVAAIRETVGPDPDLIVEAHERFTPGEAIKVGKHLEEFNPMWFEAPVQAHQGPAAFREVREALSIPISDDLASVENKFEAMDYIADRTIDVIQPDVGNVGGLREAQYVAQMADARSIFTAPHAAAGPISMTACIHLDAVVPNFKIQEGFEASTHPGWVDDVIDHPITVADGRIPVPDEPGLGVSFDEDAALEHDLPC